MPYNPDQPRDQFGRWTNAPGSPYVTSKTIPQLKGMRDENGYISAGADKGRRQCVSLVKAAIPELGPTSEWTRGPDIRGADDPQLRPGTAIGTGFDEHGNYPNNNSGNHVAIVVGPGDRPGTVKILDQGGGRPARMHDFSGDQIKRYSIITRKQ